MQYKQNYRYTYLIRSAQVRIYRFANLFYKTQKPFLYNNV